jgi:hypothetical protein
MKVGDLVEVNFNTGEAPLLAIIIGKHKTRTRWVDVRFIDDPHNGFWDYHSYPWRNLRLISES